MPAGATALLLRDPELEPERLARVEPRDRVALVPRTGSTVHALERRAPEHDPLDPARPSIEQDDAAGREREYQAHPARPWIGDGPRHLVRSEPEQPAVRFERLPERRHPDVDLRERPRTASVGLGERGRPVTSDLRRRGPADEDRERHRRGVDLDVVPGPVDALVLAEPVREPDRIQI